MIGTEIRAALEPWCDDVALLIVERSGEKRWVGRVEMCSCEPTDILAPSMRLSKTAAQQLMDNLWQCGLRPSEGTGSAGALQATEKHLEDLRRLVFEREGVQPR